MLAVRNQRITRSPIRRRMLYLLAAIAAALITVAALELPNYTRLSAIDLKEGDVAVQDIQAPRGLTYTSEVRTEQQRDAAARSVSPVYTPTDTSIARLQLEHLRTTLDYMATVRADNYASQQQKINDLTALEDIHIDKHTAEQILTLGDARWISVHQEAIVVLEQMMRNTIREGRLEEARRGVQSLVSLSLPEEQAELVARLVSGYVVPNSLYSEELTNSARLAARQQIEPVTHSYVAGETVVQRGQVLAPTDIEALEMFGLVQPQSRWQSLASSSALAFLMVVFLILYLRYNSRLAQDRRGLGLILALFLVFLIGGRLIIPGHIVIPYLFPLTAFSLVVATLFGANPALMFTLPLTILFSYGLPNSLELILFYLLSSYFGVLILGHARRLVSFFWAGAAIAIVGAVIIAVYRLPDPDSDWMGLLTLIVASLLNGIASAGLSILMQFFLAQFLGMTTALQLMEISRADYPLLQVILRTAPGTYQHSLQVANLAEQAAEEIGADPLLTRVGALYHDAGKAINPYYFIENQMEMQLNPHDDLDPATSAAIIINHVHSGLELARKHRLPRRIQDFIAEHHGTMLTQYQYAKAVELANAEGRQVDESRFRYPGPSPRSKETAILMLADGCEARIRAERPKDEIALRKIIKKVIENRIAQGQLDDTALTLRDLDRIADSFTTALRGIYHPRIEYPALENPVAVLPEINPGAAVFPPAPAAEIKKITPQTNS